MVNSLAGPQCFVQVYPHEGGPYSITGGQLLNVVTSKAFRDDAGTFHIRLAPGGPMGPNRGPTWLDIITPMSFVMIGMTRGIYSNIVMLGVVLDISETEDWTQQQVQRTVVINGQDFCRFFNMVNWLALIFLGGPTPSFAGAQAGLSGDAALGYLNSGLMYGRPNEVAQRWFLEVMSKTLSLTYVNYGGQQVKFPDFMGYWFEQYDVQIPMYDYFIASEGTWTEKFRQILQFPWYEFFVMTVPSGMFSQATGGISFTMQGLGAGVSAQAVVVGRVHPLPFVPAMISGGQSTQGQGSQSQAQAPAQITFGAIDTSKWNQLPLFQADLSFLRSTLVFNESEIRNFYVINPVTILSQWGQYNGGFLAPFTFQYAGAADYASIIRYGYRPESVTSRWFADATGEQAQSGQIDLNNLIANLMSRLTSYYEPTALMARSTITFALRPDIIPACRFRCQPGKGEPLWDFYIEGVNHNYGFGGPSFTTLNLSRGLPTQTYSDTSQGGVLSQMHIGSAQRIGGTYQAGLPIGSLQGLQAINFDNSDMLSRLTGADKAWKNPQVQ